jgi:MoxR-like ATPase
MEEHTVTVDGVGHSVPEPFLVVATQNPIDLDGTYRLPEAQLDRFMLRTSIGYPEQRYELDVLRPGSGAGRIAQVPTVTSPQQVAEAGRRLSTLHVADPILQYITDLGAATRADDRLRLGASTRGLRALVRCVQVYAASNGRHFAVPSDVQRLSAPVLAHRLVLTREAQLSGATTADVLADVVSRVEVPRPTPQ